MSGTGQPASVDSGVVAAMIGRPLRAASKVVARCHLGMPEVIEVPPLLEDGTPFPTLYWLACPLATRRVSKLESSGIMSRMQERVDVNAADAEYEGERDAALSAYPDGATHVPRGGVGGAHGGIKCLHARYAYWRVGGDDPAGAEAARRIGALDCTAPCVDLSSGIDQVSIVRPGDGIGPVDIEEPG